MKALVGNQVNPEVIINENFDTLSHVAVYGKKQDVTTGLNWGYYGGIWGGFSISDGVLTLTNTATNYVVVKRSDGTISVSTSITNWNDTANYARVYKLTTSGGIVTLTEDDRAGLYGIFGMQLPERRLESVSTAYTFVWGDMHVTKLHPSADITARTWTIPANSSVAYPLNAELDIINQHSGGVITLAITTDTMRLAGAGTTGSRSIAADGWCRVKKITATEWIVRGEGVT